MGNTPTTKGKGDPAENGEKRHDLKYPSLPDHHPMTHSPIHTPSQIMMFLSFHDVNNHHHPDYGVWSFPPLAFSCFFTFSSCP